MQFLKWSNYLYLRNFYDFPDHFWEWICFEESTFKIYFYWRHSFRDQQIAKITIFAKNISYFQTTCILGIYMIHVTTFDSKNILRESTLNLKNKIFQKNLFLFFFFAHLSYVLFVTQKCSKIFAMAILQPHGGHDLSTTEMRNNLRTKPT